jgi:uncharacterized Zn finger protein (UPF0148 family)
VTCNRCGEPVYFPSADPVRAGKLSCPRCGARTSVRSFRKRAQKWVLVAFYFAALAAFIFNCIERH